MILVPFLLTQSNEWMNVCVSLHNIYMKLMMMKVHVKFFYVPHTLSTQLPVAVYTLYFCLIAKLNCHKCCIFSVVVACAVVIVVAQFKLPISWQFHFRHFQGSNFFLQAHFFERVCVYIMHFRVHITNFIALWYDSLRATGFYWKIRSILSLTFAWYEGINEMCKFIKM